MEVARDRGRLDAEHVEVEREVGAERAVGGLGVEVAEVRREERVAAARDAERALQLGPAATSGTGAATAARTAAARSRASGAAGTPARTTESSQRRWIGRSWPRNASAIPPSRARASSSSIAIGSSERLPLVITSGTPASSQSR